MIIDYPTLSQKQGLYALWEEAFGDSEEFIDLFFSTAFSEKRCRCVMQNSEVIAALYWFDCFINNQKTAYIYAVATKKSHRGQGICAALMDNTHSLLKDRGYSGSVLVPGSKELFGFYEKMNYKTCCFNESFSCAAGEKETPIKEIDEAEFARLRRELLPSGGIVQEGENLRFLKTMMSFFKGENFLLAARKNSDKLVAAELLGDKALAPKIVKALACKEGSFRIPAKTSPFAMFFPFEKDTEIPNYLGFAFD